VEPRLRQTKQIDEIGWQLWEQPQELFDLKLSTQGTMLAASLRQSVCLHMLGAVPIGVPSVLDESRVHRSSDRRQRCRLLRDAQDLAIRCISN
jgi:hypothetical protein